MTRRSALARARLPHVLDDDVDRGEMAGGQTGEALEDVSQGEPPAGGEGE
jgi:hypothetical protein